MHFDLALGLALGGSAGFLLFVIRAAVYAASHYTRLPDGRWTTWEKTDTSASPRVDEERAA